MLSRSRPGLGSLARVSALLAGTVVVMLSGGGCASDDTTGSNPFITPVQPTDVLIERANEDEVVLRWVHNDANEDGFFVRRVVSAPAPDGSNAVIAELPAGSETFTDTDPDVLHPMTYIIEARYDGSSTASPVPAIINFDILPPMNLDATMTEPGVIRLRWLPPDFEQFEGFQILRLVERADDVFIDVTMQVLHDTSLEAFWIDSMLSTGEVGDRLTYQVTTRRSERLSPPEVTNAFQWSLPARAAGSFGAVSHVDAAGRFVTGRDAGIFVLELDGGSVTLDVIDPDLVAAQSRYIYRHPATDGSLSGALPTEETIVVAHAPADTTAVTLRGIDVDTKQELWAIDTTAPVPFVTEGRAAGSILYTDGENVVTADANGAESAVTPLGETAALAAPAAGNRLLTVEVREATGEARVTQRAYPAGTLVWTTAWFTGDLLDGNQSLRVSPDGSVLALNLDASTGELTRVVRTSDGDVLGVAEGRTIGFTADGARVIIVEAPPGWPRAYHVGDELVAEDRFGNANTTGCFLDVVRNRLWVYDTMGSMRVYDLELGWTPSLDDAVGRGAAALIARLDAGVPRFELVGP